MTFLNTYILRENSDNIGAISSTICAIHCMATPFLFIAKSCSTTCCEQTPLWWKTIDVLFLIISFIAIYYSFKNSNNNYIKLSLSINWLFLAFIIFNDFINFFTIPHWIIYIPAFILVFIHSYNKKYCLCNTSCYNNKNKT